jgi:hypothetical protein
MMAALYLSARRLARAQVSGLQLARLDKRFAIIQLAR